MRIHTKTILDLEAMSVVEDHWYLYDGPTEQAKGGESKAAAAAAAKRQEAQDALAREQLAMQRGVLSQISGGVGQFLTPEGQGFSPAALAAMRSQAIQGTSQDFEDIQRRLMTNLARRGAVGGNQPVAGGFLRDLSGLEIAREQQRSSGLLDILSKEDLLKLQNRFAATNALLGVGSQYTPAPFLEAGSSSLSTRQRAAEAADQAQSALLGSIFGGISGAASSFLGGPAFGEGGRFGGKGKSSGG